MSENIEHSKEMGHLFRSLLLLSQFVYFIYCSPTRIIYNGKTCDCNCESDCQTQSQPFEYTYQIDVPKPSTDKTVYYNLDFEVDKPITRCNQNKQVVNTGCRCSSNKQTQRYYRNTGQQFSNSLLQTPGRSKRSFNNKLSSPWNLEQTRTPRLSKFQHNRRPVKNEIPMNNYDSSDINSLKREKRNIAEEYKSMEKSKPNVTLTLPEVIQYMPETLKEDFKSKKTTCESGCEVAGNNDIKNKRNSKAETEKETTTEPNVEETAKTKNSPKSAETDPPSDMHLSQLPQNKTANNAHKEVDQSKSSAENKAELAISQTPSNFNNLGHKRHTSNSRQYNEYDYYGNVIKDILSKYADFADARIPVEDQELLNVKLYTDLLASNVQYAPFNKKLYYQ